MYLCLIFVICCIMQMHRSFDNESYKMKFLTTDACRTFLPRCTSAKQNEISLIGMGL